MRPSQHLQARSKSTPAERLLTIGELARRAGVATSALRYWEDVGLLPAPKRVSGQRRYPESALALDEQIAKAQGAREAIAHGLRCRHEDILRCPNFARGITARLAGQSLQEAHSEAHSH